MQRLREVLCLMTGRVGALMRFVMQFPLVVVSGAVSVSSGPLKKVIAAMR